MSTLTATSLGAFPALKFAPVGTIADTEDSANPLSADVDLSSEPTMTLVRRVAPDRLTVRLPDGSISVYQAPPGRNIFDVLNVELQNTPLEMASRADLVNLNLPDLGDGWLEV